MDFDYDLPTFDRTTIPSSSKFTEDRLRAALRRIEAHDKARADVFARLSGPVPSLPSEDSSIERKGKGKAGMGALSRTASASSADELAHLLAAQKRENRRLRKHVDAAAAEIASSSAHAADRVNTFDSALARLRDAVSARQETDSELLDLKDQVDVWKSQVDRAQREVARAKEGVLRVERGALGAERERDEERRRVWNEERDDVRRRAREAGRREGVREGWRRAMRGEVPGIDDLADGWTSDPQPSADRRRRQRDRGRTIEERYAYATDPEFDASTVNEGYPATSASHHDQVPRTRAATRERGNAFARAAHTGASPLSSDELLPMDAYMDPDNPEYVGRTGIRSRSRSQSRRPDTDANGMQHRDYVDGARNPLGNAHLDPRDDPAYANAISFSPGPTLGTTAYHSTQSQLDRRAQSPVYERPPAPPRHLLPASLRTPNAEYDDEGDGAGGGMSDIDAEPASTRRRLLTPSEAEDRAATGWEDARGLAGVQRRQAQEQRERERQFQAQEQEFDRVQREEAVEEARAARESQLHAQGLGRTVSGKIVFSSSGRNPSSNPNLETNGNGSANGNGGGAAQSLLGVISNLFRSSSKRSGRSGSSAGHGTGQGASAGGGEVYRGPTAGPSLFAPVSVPSGAHGASAADQYPYADAFSSLPSPPSEDVRSHTHSRAPSRARYEDDLPDPDADDPALRVEGGDRPSAAAYASGIGQVGMDTPGTVLRDPLAVAGERLKLRVVNSTEEVNGVENSTPRSARRVSLLPAGQTRSLGHASGSPQREARASMGGIDMDGSARSDPGHGPPAFGSGPNARMLATPPTSPPASLHSRPSALSFTPSGAGSGGSGLLRDRRASMPMPYRGPRKPSVLTKPPILGADVDLGGEGGGGGGVGGSRRRMGSPARAAPRPGSAGGGAKRGLGSLW